MTSEQLRDAFHYLYRDELPALKRLAQMLPPNPSVVNIGAGAGTSGLAFLESRPDLFLVTIDIENEDSPLGSLYSERQVIEASGMSESETDRWMQIHGDSKFHGTHWQGYMLYYTYRTGLVRTFDSFDMVFIDGDHSYEGCKGDIDAWLGNIKPGGLIVVHDYNKQLVTVTADGPHPRVWEGVNQAVDELLYGGYEMVLYVDSLIAFRIP